MNKKIITAALAVLALGATSTFAATSTVESPATAGERPMMNHMMKRSHQGSGSLEGMGSGMMMKGLQGPMMDTGMKAALEANDYSAFVTAFNTMLANRTTPTQTEFDTMVVHAKEMEANKPERDDTRITNDNNDDTRKAQHEAIRAAVLANDYAAFVKAFEAATPSVPTQAEFTTMVEYHKTMQTAKESVKEAKTNLKQAKKNLTTTKKNIRKLKRANSTTQSSTTSQ